MTRQVVSSPWPVWGTAGSRVLLAAGWGGRGLDHRCLWQSDPPCGCTPVGEKSTLRLVLFWEFLIKLNNLTWQTNAAYAIKKTQQQKTPQKLIDLGVIWRVVLHDPVHLGDVQPSSCHVCAQQDAGVSVAELEEGGGTFGLLLFALRNDTKQRNAQNSCSCRSTSAHRHPSNIKG